MSISFGDCRFNIEWGLLRGGAKLNGADGRANFLWRTLFLCMDKEIPPIIQIICYSRESWNPRNPLMLMLSHLKRIAQFL